jgi:hypothetical protein
LVNHCAMPSIGQTWVLASIGAVVEMGILSTLKRLLMGCACMPKLPSPACKRLTYSSSTPVLPPRTIPWWSMVHILRLIYWLRPSPSVPVVSSHSD